MMKGYRTILAAFVLFLIGKAGITLTVPQANLFLQLWPDVLLVGGIVLRFMTTTPVGQKELQLVESKLGLTAADLQPLLDLLPKQADFASLAGAVTQLRVDLTPALASLRSVPAPAATPVPPIAIPQGAGNSPPVTSAPALSPQAPAPLPSDPTAGGQA